MSPEFIEILGILLGLLCSFLLAELLANRRALTDERAIRWTYEARIDAAHANFSSERDLLRLAAEMERRAWNTERDRLQILLQMERDEHAKERAGLIDRLQAWTPTAPTAPEPEKPGSHIPEMQDEDLSEAQLDALEAEGFSPTLDGQGWMDTRSGVVYESLDEARKWRKNCQVNGLPESTDPREHLGRKL